MKTKKLIPLFRGLTATMASVIVLSSVGYTIADANRSLVDTALGTESYITDTSKAKYVNDYATEEELQQATKDFAIREGEEGTVIMKNENTVLPLKGDNTQTVALFGLAGYGPYYGPDKGGNSDSVDLVKALENAGVKLNESVKTMYEKIMNPHEVETVNPWTGEVTGTEIAFDNQANFSAGDYTDFKVTEVPVSMYSNAEWGGENWESSAESDVGIVVFCRPGGEGTTYKPGSGLDYYGNNYGDPLALSPEELALVAKAKELCDKVVVLLNTSCTIEVGQLKSGTYAVDGIAYIGIPNDYQLTGVANVLTGKVNATGALADTYATSSVSSPAMQNFGGGYYADYDTLAVDGSTTRDDRWGNTAISNDVTGSFGGSASYSGGYYIVEAEGIYTGYSYYETRYYDAIMGQGNADSTKGSTQGGAWDYDKEVSYTFGHGLSYIPYTQTITEVNVEDSVDGNITAKVAVHNDGDKTGLFLAQLYVSQPYTQYDKDNLVEKSAIMFLNSKKVEVAAGQTVTVEISVPTKYLASYDYTNAKTYILDEGNYYFTAAAGAHDAVNNVIKAIDSSKEVDGDAQNVKVWNNSAFDNTTYSKSENGMVITNQMDDASLNYWLPGTVTELSRKDWEGTYPKNYNTEVSVAILRSDKAEEWKDELVGKTYEITENGTVENPDGVDLGEKYKFGEANIGQPQLENINDDFWNKLVSQISVNEAIGAVIHGGSTSDVLTNVDNPNVPQADGPTGFKDGRFTNGFRPAVNSQSLLGSSFNPDLAHDWGVLLGNHGLQLKKYEIWGAGLNYHRTPYNGRNTEYLSEDPMLTNVLGAAQIEGSNSKGIIVGPKHIGFNDQEHDRSGICVYMNEQKFRQTDMRGFQGAVEDAGALGMMVAFNRLGATNASHSVGMLKKIIREEWGFNGLISTDMMNNKYYFNAESCIMATITMMADFAQGDNYISKSGDKTAGDSTWSYITIESASKDQALVDQARENLKYQLYAFANSALLNITTERVTPWWDATLQGIFIGSAVLTGLSAAAYVALVVLNTVKKEEE